MSLKDKIGAVRNEFRAALDKFPADPIKIDELRVRFLGRKGEVAQLFSTMGSIAAEERAEAGKLLNELKVEVQSLFDSAVENVSKNQRKQKTDSAD